MAQSECSLMARILAGDPVAFEQLFARYSVVVRHHLQRMVRDTAAAEDLVQEVFLRVWQRAEQWQGAGTLNSWLLGIATNLALNHLRTVRRRHERPLAPNEAGADLLPTAHWLLDDLAVA